ncbi:MAG: TIGR04053 family radical SAM/SPASM domain-containing protein [Candidatus Marsarchaeota archaeon]|nr:TIGR04053 family radical SAM/SPASM domain-containing protein [Candidatus Marsarchaeota archaeon]
MHGYGVARPNFGSKPVLVFWETTRACPLACRHCRASAIRDPMPGELSTAEGMRLIDSVAAFGTPAPLIVFTGGDPMVRKDLFVLMDHARSAGIRFAASPAVSQGLDRHALERLRDAGVTSISVSLDGACSDTHDRIRNVGGTFDATLRVIRESVSIGLSIQVNTTVMRSNIDELARIFHLIKSMGVRTWEVFFLIRVGRGAELEDITPSDSESVCNFLYDASMCGMTVRTVEAPFIRRVAMMRASAGRYWHGIAYERLSAELMSLGHTPDGKSSIAPVGTLDGDGIIFVAYDGTVHPGGFLPVVLGNVRDASLVGMYRGSAPLTKIRDREFVGRCNDCEYKAVCGGSRARAYASSSNALGSDPACVHEPGARAYGASTTIEG